MKTLTRDAIYENKDIENINCGILDTGGNFDNMGDELCYSQLLKLDSLWINAIVCSLMIEIVIYLPFGKLVRASNHIIFMLDKGGSSNSNFNRLADNLNIKI